MSVNRNEQGFSLIEVLVALVVLTVGMLGIAALYAESMGHHRSAIYRAQAVRLAGDLAERIRANRNAGDKGDAYTLDGSGMPLMQDCIAATLGCTATALAHDDLARWLVAIHDSLPGDGVNTPNGNVAVDTVTTPARYTITISWLEPGGAGPRTYALEVRA